MTVIPAESHDLKIECRLWGARHTMPIRPRRSGGQARFGQLCTGCPLRAACTKARSGRVITIHPHEATLQQAKARQRDPAWQHAYRANRPIAERKISHFTRRPWGGRKARCRGQARTGNQAKDGEEDWGRWRS